MKRNISVFILLILLASSFKYRTKTRAITQPVITAGYDSPAYPKGAVKSSMDAAVADLQKANHELAKGNPALFKSLWSHRDDVTIFGGVGNADSKGWSAVEASLNNAGHVPAQEVVYTFEKIASQEELTQGYLIQKEHYRFADGRRADLHVTILFRKENNVWKIAHRHADPIASVAKSDKTAK
ncbi:nuclear transport factor 2 family protein [Dyadobacter sp. CY261]|uniref:nuclear transport factor 2 family protein n=1 Tax=Dyadobacter sp. CY261 TaxID=2907203 RepID=UPI001F366F28|nr:nuclear transport factor 2 family protein [Dyadobacter sp. CY261]MCF0070340.1 nuclear transport factor 2 family protein [Dyadobacter sp. CY261]